MCTVCNSLAPVKFLQVEEGEGWGGFIIWVLWDLGVNFTTDIIGKKNTKIGF